MNNSKTVKTDTEDQTNIEKCLIMLFAPPAFEESLVDWLLEYDCISGFSTTESYGHGQRSSAMSLLEQVAARQRRIQFAIEIDSKLASVFLKEIGLDFPGLHYMVMPLLSAGRL
ncbi:MAG: DUF3240 domain-containing protein [Betaproteobacteria bacterium]|nr:DUF3240 domain-containing protein [Betaproteobacteria bacterium]